MPKTMGIASLVIFFALGAAAQQAATPSPTTTDSAGAQQPVNVQPASTAGTAQPAQHPSVTASAAQEKGPRWTLLVDPVCPVANFYGTPFPNSTRELRVLYFPGSKAAKLKNPEGLMLRAGINRPKPFMNNSASAPFAKKGDSWEAVLPAEKLRAVYAIFAVVDEKTGEVDDNSGQYWDVVFCGPTGKKDPNGLQREAESYTGVAWPQNIARTKDYGKAISLLEATIANDPRRSDLMQMDLWKYKAERDGADAQAWAKVGKEVEQYVAEHQNDRSMLSSAGNFLVRYDDKLPNDCVDRMVAALDAKLQETRKSSYRVDVEYSGATRERDEQKRLAALDEFIAKYPDERQAAFAQQSRFYVFLNRGDVNNAEAAFAKYREGMQHHANQIFDPNLHNDYLALARLYVDKRVKLDEALKLADLTLELLKSNPTAPGMTLSAEHARWVETGAALVKAKAYLALHKGDLAEAEALKALAVRKSDPETCFVAAQAYAATGKKDKALEAYFEAALLPSNKDLEYRSELERYYLKQHFGKRSQFEAVLAARRKARFEAAHYSPKLLDKAAPALEFVTLKGEKFDAATLHGKTVVVNFWSPG